MKRALLTLVLLFVSPADAASGDFSEGLAAYARGDYATAFEKFMKAAEPPPVKPAWEDFRAKLAPLVPEATEDDLRRYWEEKYGASSEASARNAQFYLGLIYKEGRGVPQDYQQAAYWYTKAALAGVVEAQFNLGLMYDLDEGVPQDYRTALFWYTKAAEQGDSGAQNNLGVMYERGKGVPQDFVQAHKWFNISGATATNKEQRDRAFKNRDLVARNMSPQQLGEAQRLAREWKPPTGRTPDRQQGSDGSELAASGTGFVVTPQGHVLTNHHVVEGCQTVRATVEGDKKRVTVVGTDAENDLALLKLATPVPSVARFREGRTIRPGDSVVVVGFPLHRLLASETKVTTGTVSAMAGLGNDTRFLQITAPVQPGNSGGPLLDSSGNVVGVVVSKLDALTIARATGDIPQNVNFAINGVVAKAFLDSQSVEYETGSPTKPLEPAEVAKAAKQFTVLLECHR